MNLARDGNCAIQVEYCLSCAIEVPPLNIGQSLVCPGQPFVLQVTLTMVIVRNTDRLDTLGGLPLS